MSYHFSLFLESDRYNQSTTSKLGWFLSFSLRASAVVTFNFHACLAALVQAWSDDCCQHAFTDMSHCSFIHAPYGLQIVISRFLIYNHIPLGRTLFDPAWPGSSFFIMQPIPLNSLQHLILSQSPLGCKSVYLAAMASSFNFGSLISG